MIMQAVVLVQYEPAVDHNLLIQEFTHDSRIKRYQKSYYPKLLKPINPT